MLSSAYIIGGAFCLFTALIALYVLESNKVNSILHCAVLCVGLWGINVYERYQSSLVRGHGSR
jgi:uncharacterized membrane protein (GlpM family)